MQATPSLRFPTNPTRLWSRRLHRPVMWETLTIAIICFVDMAWTIAAVKMGVAREGNPVMGTLMERGILWFALGKMLSFLLPLAGLELLRERIPKFVSLSMRVGLVAYILIYTIGSINLSIPH
jgi:hypothetical protein